MADFLTKSQRSDLMRRVKLTATKPERMLVKSLRRLGTRPEINVTNLPGKPDIVFRSDRLACFVDGEYWHGVQWRRRGLSFLAEQFSEKANRDYWIGKVHRNIERDIRNTGALLRMGWTVIRFWESEVHRDPDHCAARIVKVRAGRVRGSRFSRAAAATAADFFAGIGLMRLGLSKAGWKTVWANDFDAVKQRFYLHNLDDEQVEFDPRPIDKVGVGRVPSVGIVAACFPCTDLSLAGAGRGLEDGKQSSAYLRFATMLAHFGSRRPPFVILENVLGLIHSREGKDFRICLERLARAGYSIDAVKVDASHFVPQSRPRLFVVGVRDDIDLMPYITAESFVRPDQFRPASLFHFVQTNKDLPWAIRPLPSLPQNADRLEQILDQFDSAHGTWWPSHRVQRLMEQVSERHLSTLTELLKVRGVVWATAFRRMRHGRSMAELRFDGIAGCLRTPKGGSAKQIVIRADQNGWMVRLLRVAECARLIGADSFRTDATGTTVDNALFGFGDAVCVPVVEWLVRNYVNPIMAELLRGRVLKTGGFSRAVPS